MGIRAKRDVIAGRDIAGRDINYIFNVSLRGLFAGLFHREDGAPAVGRVSSTTEPMGADRPLLLPWLMDRDRQQRRVEQCLEGAGARSRHHLVALLRGHKAECQYELVQRLRLHDLADFWQVQPELRLMDWPRNAEPQARANAVQRGLARAVCGERGATVENLLAHMASLDQAQFVYLELYEQDCSGESPGVLRALLELWARVPECRGPDPHILFVGLKTDRDYLTGEAPTEVDRRLDACLAEALEASRNGFVLLSDIAPLQGVVEPDFDEWARRYLSEPRLRTLVTQQVRMVFADDDRIVLDGNARRMHLEEMVAEIEQCQEGG